MEQEKRNDEFMADSMMALALPDDGRMATIISKVLVKQGKRIKKKQKTKGKSGRIRKEKMILPCCKNILRK